MLAVHRTQGFIYSLKLQKKTMRSCDIIHEPSCFCVYEVCVVFPRESILSQEATSREEMMSKYLDVLPTTYE